MSLVWIPPVNNCCHKLKVVAFFFDTKINRWSQPAAAHSHAKFQSFKVKNNWVRGGNGNNQTAMRLFEGIRSGWGLTIKQLNPSGSMVSFGLHKVHILLLVVSRFFVRIIESPNFWGEWRPAPQACLWGDTDQPDLLGCRPLPSAIADLNGSGVVNYYKKPALTCSAHGCGSPALIWPSEVLSALHVAILGFIYSPNTYVNHYSFINHLPLKSQCCIKKYY